MKILKIVLPMMAAVVLSSCSGSNPSSATVQENVVFNAALSDVDQAFDNVGSLLPSVAAFSFFSNQSSRDDLNLLTTNPFTETVWTLTPVGHPGCSGDPGDPYCGTNVTVQEYMGFQIDPEAKRGNGSPINVFGRIKNSIRILCALMNLASPLNATTGYPADGAQTVTFTAAHSTLLVNTCGFAAADVPPAGETMTFTTSTPTSTAIYDKKMIIDDGAGTLETFYFRTNASTVNLLSAEVSATQTSRSSIQLNRTTHVLRAELIGAPITIDSNSGSEFQRLFANPSASVATVLSYGRDFSGSPIKTAFAMTGKPGVAGAELGLSLRSNTVAGLAWNSPRRACVSQATGTIATDGPDTFTCSGQSAFSLEDMGAAIAIIADLDTNVFTGSVTGPSGGAKLTHSSVVNESFTLPFTTTTTMFTNNVSHQ